MLKTVSQYKDSVAALLSGVDINNIDNLNGALERAARVLVQKADVPEASGTQNIVLYSGVYNYACSPKIFGTAINDIRPQGISRPVSDFVYKRPGEQFDRTKGWLPNGTMATFEYYNGQPIIRIVSKTPQQQVIIDQMNSTTGWVAGSPASSLVQDTAVYYQAPASLRFTAGSGTGTLTKTLTNSLSLSSYQGVGVAFLAIQIPVGSLATDLAAISLKLGSSSSNYNFVVKTEGFIGAWVSGEWLLVAFDFSAASTVGTPDWNSISYVQILITTLTNQINFRVGGLFICQPSPAQILYQSAAIFLPSGSQTALTTITSNTDSIILNDPAFTLFEYEGALSVLQQTGGGKGDSMTARLQEELKNLYMLFLGDNPSQELRMSGNYYSDDGYGGMNGY